jgi:hypothetical protein
LGKLWRTEEKLQWSTGEIDWENLGQLMKPNDKMNK